eukprot:363424-Chlamydomonas_euryale.AAC.15
MPAHAGARQRMPTHGSEYRRMPSRMLPQNAQHAASNAAVGAVVSTLCRRQHAFSDLRRHAGGAAVAGLQAVDVNALQLFAAWACHIQDTKVTKAVSWVRLQRAFSGRRTNALQRGYMPRSGFGHAEGMVYTCMEKAWCTCAWKKHSVHVHGKGMVYTCMEKAWCTRAWKRHGVHMHGKGMVYTCM